MPLQTKEKLSLQTAFFFVIADENGSCYQPLTRKADSLLAKENLRAKFLVRLIESGISEQDIKIDFDSPSSLSSDSADLIAFKNTKPFFIAQFFIEEPSPSDIPQIKKTLSQKALRFEAKYIVIVSNNNELWFKANGNNNDNKTVPAPCTSQKN
ncbi:hypothetical protein COT20_00525 [bacterium (Candidatus Gribaldobacteria) CG08_land_8_20_14_0_20_39_15]|uniref:Type I restriction enzyme R protein N-terminal domain-containing protein n=1 Tax=bacterium (Candidatus Gribaldobacteria) CG08_land_8_20_14_0_20_39_15 TaxID=2014273 RepID=A0A2M6XV39_9BACT|nr:MAG: hypothetical protein COT20_00525 [bacterium (Candidatus Gribaldobacteria) CG08_land_8_20_14_0_20_39_15]